MSRESRFNDYYSQNVDKGFMGCNVSPIYQNLSKAMEDGKLKEFLMNKSPYRCAYPYFYNWAGRNKDQSAIVMALNIYGRYNPGFADTLNKTLTQLAKGNIKELLAVVVLVATQIQLQELEVSLIDFMDKELVNLVLSRLKKMKVLRIIMYIFLIVAVDLAMMGLGFNTGSPLFFLFLGPLIPLFIIRLAYWSGIASTLKPSVLNGAREIREYVEE